MLFLIDNPLELITDNRIELNISHSGEVADLSHRMIGSIPPWLTLATAILFNPSCNGTLHHDNQFRCNSSVKKHLEYLYKQHQLAKKMVSISEIRQQIATIKTLGPGLVAVFGTCKPNPLQRPTLTSISSTQVGGTSGIGLSTAREFTRHATAPHIYLIGRNETQASEIISELQTINESAKVDFIKSDISLLQNVDAACQEIIQKEPTVNLLFLSAGILTTQGRTGTSSPTLHSPHWLNKHNRNKRRYRPQTQHPLLRPHAIHRQPSPLINPGRVIRPARTSRLSLESRQ